MAGQTQIMGQAVVEMMTLLDKNYESLWDLFNERRVEEFSHPSEYRQIRHRIFQTLGEQIKGDIEDFWSPFRYTQDIFNENLIFGETSAEDWPTGSFEWNVRRHRHNVLLKDMGLSYSFTATGHPSEELGVSQSLIPAIDKVLDAQKLVNAELEKFTPEPIHKRPRRVRVQPSTSAPTSDLFHSPTAQFPQSHQQSVAEEYHSVAHGCVLRKPVSLTTSAQREDELYRFRKHLYLARAMLKTGRMNGFKTMIRRTQNINRDPTWAAILSDWGDCAVVSGMLGKEQRGIMNDINKHNHDVGYPSHCMFCSHVAQSNLLMLKQRLTPGPDSLQFLNKNMIRNIFRLYHNQEELVTLETRTVVTESFEHQIRRVARQIDTIVNQAVHHTESGGQHPERSSSPLGQRVLRDITNIAKHPMSTIADRIPVTRGTPVASGISTTVPGRRRTEVPPPPPPSPSPQQAQGQQDPSALQRDRLRESDRQPLFRARL